LLAQTCGKVNESLISTMTGVCDTLNAKKLNIHLF
jgi:hypothetical protein